MLVLVLNDNYAWKLAHIQDCLELYSTPAHVQTIQADVWIIQISHNKAGIVNFIKKSFVVNYLTRRLLLTFNIR